MTKFERDTLDVLKRITELILHMQETLNEIRQQLYWIYRCQEHQTELQTASRTTG